MLAEAETVAAAADVLGAVEVVAVLAAVGAGVGAALAAAAAVAAMLSLTWFCTRARRSCSAMTSRRMDSGRASRNDGSTPSSPGGTATMETE